MHPHDITDHGNGVFTISLLYNVEFGMPVLGSMLANFRRAHPELRIVSVAEENPPRNRVASEDVEASFYCIVTEPARER